MFQTQLDESSVHDTLQGLTSLFTAPVVLLLAEGIKQPLVQAAVQEGLILSERLQETLAETQEIWEDLAVRARATLEERRQQEFHNPVNHNGHAGGADTWVRDSQVALEIEDVMAMLNQQVGVMTQGMVDLRLLVPLGLGAFALRQLLTNGLQVEQIPWYTVAWYAFDSFIKLNHGTESSPLYPIGD